MIVFTLNDTAINRMMMKKPDVERFLQVLDSQFRLFALILSVSPQKLCGFHPIYYLHRSDEIRSYTRNAPLLVLLGLEFVFLSN